MLRNCKNEKELKFLYRKLALRLHPDHGGSKELMILLTECYEKSLKDILDNEQPKKKYSVEEVIKKSQENYKKHEEAKRKQQEKKQNKNLKFEMIQDREEVCNGDDKLDLIEIILNYAKKNSSFDSDFVESVKEYLDQMGYITSNQYNSLVKIYRRFKIFEEQS